MIYELLLVFTAEGDVLFVIQSAISRTLFVGDIRGD